MHKKIVVEQWGEGNIERTKNIINNLLSNEKMTTYLLKFPGEIIEGFDYPVKSFISCFSFKEQDKSLATFSLKTILVDATYNTNKYNSVLIIFYVYKKDEISIPFLEVLTDHEIGYVVEKCASLFKTSHPELDWGSLSVLMTDMSATFINGIKKACESNIKWL